MNALINDLQLHADRTQIALVHGAQLPWVMSPQHGVERRMLERSGGEVAVATTIVQYQPNSRFSSHVHELGEEFLVLAGVFCDEHGHYPVGTYVRNPPGSSHTPYSDQGCVLFVKLRQMIDDENARIAENTQVVVYPAAHSWHDNYADGCERALLYDNDRICVELLRLQPGCQLPERVISNGEELLVIEGSVIMLAEASSQLTAWSWLRHPGDRHPSLISEQGALLWIKHGHLNGMRDAL